MSNITQNEKKMIFDFINDFRQVVPGMRTDIAWIKKIIAQRTLSVRYWITTGIAIIAIVIAGAALWL